MEMDMTKITGFVLLFIGTAGFALAGVAVAAPEIDPATGLGALTLLSGGLLVLRARRNK
jgi:hypothetical protein